MKTKLKPVFAGFFFLLFFETISGTEVIDSIIDKNNLKNLEFFFTKTIELATGEIVGKITGKVIFSEDSTKYFVLKDGKSQIFGFDYKGIFEEIDGKKSYNKDTLQKFELDVGILLNPVEKLVSFKYFVRDEYILFESKNEYFDSVKLFYAKNFYYDSLIFFKNGENILSTHYTYNGDFPYTIITFDKVKNITEKIKNYKTKFFY